jgi:hypothetical protein
MFRSTDRGRGAGPVTSDGPLGYTNGRAGHCLAAQARNARTRITQGTTSPGRFTAATPPSCPTGGTAAQPWSRPRECGRPTRRAGAVMPIRAAVSSVGAESSAFSVESPAITWGLGGGAPGVMICGIGFSPEAVGGLSMAGG